MPVDFQTNQLNVNQIINSSPSGKPLLIYGLGSSTNNSGGFNAAHFATGSDVWLFISGTAGSRNSANRGAVAFGGDVVVSGALYNAANVFVSGSVFVTGSVNVKGSIVPSADVTYDLGSPSLRWQNIYTGDLHLRNERGDYTLIEEEGFLSIRFNKTGKRYKFLLEPVPELDEKRF